MGNGLLWPSDEARGIFPRYLGLDVAWSLLASSECLMVGLARRLEFLLKDWLVIAVHLFPKEDLHSSKQAVGSHSGNTFLMSLDAHCSGDTGT